MTNETDIPTVDSEQVSELAASSASHAQMCNLIYGDGDKLTNYTVIWDGEMLRLMQPHAVNVEESLFAYKVLGHLEVSLPNILDPVTMERQSQVLIASYLDGLNSPVEE